jgi:hypothetical protein
MHTLASWIRWHRTPEPLRGPLTRASDHAANLKFEEPSATSPAASHRAKPLDVQLSKHDSR